VEEIKMNLLAKSCFAPGLISLISNLFSSAGDGDRNEYSEDWRGEYVQGMGHEVYRIGISETDYQDSKDEKLMFKKVAEIAYQEYNAVVFALEIELKTVSKSIIRLNPSKFEFIDWHLYNYYLYLVCENESVSKRVQKFEMPDDKYERHIGKPRIDKNK
jgi:Calcium-activated BK potassium channel alpha subunit